MTNFISKMGKDEIQELGGEEMNAIGVEALVAGIADIIGMPDSLVDLDRNLTRRVLWIEAETLDGERHILCFLPHQARLLEEALDEYKRLLLSEMMDQHPDRVRDLLDSLKRLLDDE